MEVWLWFGCLQKGRLSTAYNYIIVDLSTDQLIDGGGGAGGLNG